MPEVEFVSLLHKKTNRDYLMRVTEFPKYEAACIAKKFGMEYWDGDRKVGYGGYHYDGRWRIVAEKMVQFYDIKPGDRLLDVGCGKGFLLYDLTQLIPGLQIAGIDISNYAIRNAKPEIKSALQIAHANQLPFPDKSFDHVISVNMLHNLYCYDLELALREIERVGKKNKFVCIESYRNEIEKTNLLYWQLTCEAFCTPSEWQWWFKKTGYTGDYEFIYFE